MSDDGGNTSVRYFNTVCLASPEGKIVSWRMFGQIGGRTYQLM